MSYRAGIGVRLAAMAGVESCEDEDADPHSDVAHFYDGLRWAYAATEWERVK